MKKIVAFILTAVMLLSALSLCVGAAENSKWVIGKDATVVLPAEITKGYSEMNSDLLDVDLTGFNYLHVTVSFATDFHVEWVDNAPGHGSWGYMLMSDNESVASWENTQNVVTYNILVETKDYTANTPRDFVIPISAFTAYGVGSIVPTEWTNNLRRLRFVYSGGGLNGNPEITFSNIYLSVNENDAAPGVGTETPSAETGSRFVAVAAVMAVSAAAAVIVKKKEF